MSALVIAHVRPTSSDKLSAYAAAAAETLPAFGGEVLHRGAYHATLLGSAEPHGLGVMRFPDAQAAKDWFTSPAYQALRLFVMKLQT